MRTPRYTRLVLAGCLLATLPAFADPPRNEPQWVGSDARRLAARPGVDAAANRLLESTLAGADANALLARIKRIRIDSSLVPAERDAVLSLYLQQLRDLPPGAAPQPVLDWLAAAEPLAITGHEEGPHHAVPLFNVAAAARGLSNEWEWRRGHERVSGDGALPLSRLARELSSVPTRSNRYRGMLYAVERLPTPTLDRLAVHCAASRGGCGEARADIELARGNARWLRDWLASAHAAEVTPLLKRARRHLTDTDARRLMTAALRHPDPAVAALAMSDLTAHLPKDERRRRHWGMRLIGFLDHRELGGAAALQLARMDADEAWLESASMQSLGERGRRRLELLAEMTSELEAERGDNGAIQ